MIQYNILDNINRLPACKTTMPQLKYLRNADTFLAVLTGCGEATYRG